MRVRDLALRVLPVAALVMGLARRVRADDSIPDAEVLAPRSTAFVVESVTTRLSAYNQIGTGYQSKSGPILGPGSEHLTVFEPQAEIIATQGDRITHRIWVPVDVITEASVSSIPKVVDVVSGASRETGSGAIQWSTTLQLDRVSTVTSTTGVHLEPPFRSWNGGIGTTRAFADQNTVVSGSVVGILDWFDRFYVNGDHNGRAERSTTLGSAGLTQILSPTTVANVNYGLTVQQGTLGNTWNAVPLTNDTRGAELLPGERVRHALVGRLAQFLPWNGALRLYYRFYADDWGIVAHSTEGELMQRLSPTFYVGALYRFHTQTSPPFFTTLGSPGAVLRTADSDLAALQSQTIGGKAVGDVPMPSGTVRTLHYEVEYDRYWRTNDLHIDVLTCSLGLHF
jgi:Protein of unknown function (DUF3570)